MAGSDIEFTLTVVSSSSKLIERARLSPRGVAGADCDTGLFLNPGRGMFSIECERERELMSKGVVLTTVSLSSLVCSSSKASVASSNGQAGGFGAVGTFLSGGDCSNTLARASACDVVRLPWQWTGDRHCSGVAMALARGVWTELEDSLGASLGSCGCSKDCLCWPGRSSTDSLV